MLTEMKMLRHACNDPDTRHYWNLTKHIFRYDHRAATDNYNGIHTINEGQKTLVRLWLGYSCAACVTAVRAEGFLEQIRFITRLILNADQSDLLA